MMVMMMIAAMMMLINPRFVFPGLAKRSSGPTARRLARGGEKSWSGAETLHTNETARRDWPREGPNGLMS